jgi:thiamine-phosphate pyrophosphorylase
MSATIPCQTYLITPGDSTPGTFSADSAKILELIKKAVEQKISLVQIREKNLFARQLFELAAQAVSIAKNTGTKLLVSDRADIAFAAGADGVHLTSHSLPTAVIRQNFPPEFTIGVSTHSLETALAAKEQGADLIVFGPVFTTKSKAEYGAPQGIEKLSEVVKALKDFPVFALGGINKTNYEEALETGATGIASIGWFYEMLTQLF